MDTQHRLSKAPGPFALIAFIGFLLGANIAFGDWGGDGALLKIDLIALSGLGLLTCYFIMTNDELPRKDALMD